MTREIWLGPVLNDNRDRLIEECASRLNAGRADSFVYLAASRPLLDRVTTSILGRLDKSGIWGNLSIHLFRGFVRRIISRTVIAATQQPLTPRLRIDTSDSPIRRNLVALLLQKLAAEGKLGSIAPLVHKEGCATTVERLLGEFQRAGTSAAAFQHIIELRANDHLSLHDDEADGSTAQASQQDFDSDLASIYKAYADRLNEFELTEDDADQLQALEILGGDLLGVEVETPWMSSVDLLIVDGFYDFTPIQGDILKRVIPRIPNVVINLNADPSNPEIFLPFAETRAMFEAISSFEVQASAASETQSNTCRGLRTRLFNPEIHFADPTPADALAGSTADNVDADDVRVFRCSNSAKEIRAISKEIKRLVFSRGYLPAEIAVVFRQPAPYVDLLNRIFDDEGIPCDLGKSIPILEIAPIRAAVKLFELLSESWGESADQLKLTLFSSVIKSGYFRFGWRSGNTVKVAEEAESGAAIAVHSSSEITPDDFENAIAFVGEGLTVRQWLARAERLTANDGISSSLSRDDDQLSANEEESDPQASDESEQARREKRKPSVQVESGWVKVAMSEIRRLTGALNSLTRNGSAETLKESTFSALQQFGFIPFSESELFTDVSAREDLPGITESRAIEGLHQALDSAVRCFKVAYGLSDQSPSYVHTLGEFLKRTIGCLEGIEIETRPSGRRGVPVLAATDVRGLRFRAIFIAGLVEGHFPMRPRHDWIYPHEERTRLRKYGLTLEDTSPTTLLKEEHYFYQAACRATERLYLTFPVVSNDGAETVESYYLNEFKRALLPLKVETMDLTSVDVFEELSQSSTPAELRKCRKMTLKATTGTRPLRIPLFRPFAIGVDERDICRLKQTENLPLLANVRMAPFPISTERLRTTH